MLAILKIDKLVFKEATKSTRVFWRWVKNAITARVRRDVESRDVFTQIKLSRQSELSPAIGIQSETGMFIVGRVSPLTAINQQLRASTSAYRWDTYRA